MFNQDQSQQGSSQQGGSQPNPQNSQQNSQQTQQGGSAISPQNPQQVNPQPVNPPMNTQQSVQSMNGAQPVNPQNTQQNAQPMSAGQQGSQQQANPQQINPQANTVQPNPQFNPMNPTQAMPSPMQGSPAFDQNQGVATQGQPTPFNQGMGMQGGSSGQDPFAAQAQQQGFQGQGGMPFGSGMMGADPTQMGGQMGQQAPKPEDTTPANYQLGALLPKELTAKIPSHQLHFDEAYFLRLLAGSISLSKDEKKRIIESVPKLRQSQIDELIRIFEEEKEKFAQLSAKHVPQLEKLAKQHLNDWLDLEAEQKLQDKKKDDDAKAEEIRKQLGL